MLLLLQLSLLIAVIARTVTQEEVFKELKDHCVRCHKDHTRPLHYRKFYYLFTCQYCFSHWVSLGVIVLTNYHFLYNDWRGYIFALFSLVAVSNMYLSLYEYLRVLIKSERSKEEYYAKLAKDNEDNPTDVKHLVFDFADAESRAVNFLSKHDPDFNPSESRRAG